MSVVLKTIDQVLGAARSAGPQLSFPVEQITARQIVRTRVLMEVERYNSSAPEHAFSLIAPAQVEQLLNAPRRPERRKLNLERQVEAAIDAVRRGRIIIMFNGEQVRDIDAALLITPVSEAQFLRLLPLVGG